MLPNLWERDSFVRELARRDDGRGEDGWLLELEACNVGDTGRNDAGVGSLHWSCNWPGRPG
jgi:hypothetical protein